MNEKEDGEEEEERQETDDEEWRPPAEVQTDQIRLFQINITLPPNVKALVHRAVVELVEVALVPTLPSLD